MQYYPTYTPKNEEADVFTIGIRSDNGDKYYCNICFNSPLFMTRKMNETQRLNVREAYIPMTKTTSTDSCTSYPDHIPLALRIYLGG